MKSRARTRNNANAQRERSQVRTHVSTRAHTYPLGCAPPRVVSVVPAPPRSRVLLESSPREEFSTAVASACNLAVRSAPRVRVRSLSGNSATFPLNESSTTPRGESATSPRRLQLKAEHDFSACSKHDISLGQSATFTFFAHVYINPIN
jgi:hypothetical protein